MSDIRIVHIGVKRRSGRYPWGSGGELLSAIDRLAAKGLSEKEIAAGLGMSTGQLRNQKALVTGELKEAQRLNVLRQKERGMSVAAIAREVKLPESTVRDLLRPAANWKYRFIKQISDSLRSIVDRTGFVDIGEGVEIFVGASRTKLDNAVTLLENEGYQVFNFKTEQLGTDGKRTNIKILAAPGKTFQDVLDNRANITIPNFKVRDSGITEITPDSINNISSDRILVRWKEDGGAQKDGLIEMRRIPELSLGDNAYGQVRIGVDGTHYMKGMAVYGDNIPDGYDIVYNVSAERSSDKLAAMKPQREMGASRFGAVVSPNIYEEGGVEKFGVVNIVGDKNLAVEGSWADWDRNLASQVLSKQSHRLAKKQLEIVYQNQQAELDEILSLTNPTVRSHLLMEFADKVDRASIDLKAAALPRQTTNVILPDPDMKPGEIYAPNYDDGERVALIRYPHGGIFEIPELTVNNRGSKYRDLIGPDAEDAVAIHPEVAAKLSGADFDGDFVLVIPNKRGEIRTSPSLTALKDFNPREAYPYYDGMTVMTERQKQRLMGDVSNLITDMTIKGASQDEIARAVKHSMVVIDAAKHELNYKQSAIDNGIAALKERYQGGARRGASTLISRARGEARVPARRDHYTIDEVTGEKVWTYTDETYISKKNGREIVVPRTTRTTQMDREFDLGQKDAYNLSSGTVIEGVYAEHANRMRALANKARLATLSQKPVPYSPKARATYQAEVDSLDAKYKEAVRHRPIERKAQLLAGEIYKSMKDSDPGMSRSDKSKAKGRALQLARTRLGAKKPVVEITPREWQAIELGAVSPTRLRGILRNADMDLVRQHATPRATRAGLSSGKATRAKQLLKSGYTNAEVAAALGVSMSLIRDIDKG